LVFVGSAFSTLFSLDTAVVSRKHDNLPWPLLNPHSLDFLTTHGLHCYYATVETLQKDDLNWVDHLHLQHCAEDMKEVIQFLSDHDGFMVPELFCPQITGNGKKWQSTAEDYKVLYYNSSTYLVTLKELLSKDVEMAKVYTKGGKLYSNYQNAGLGNAEMTSEVIKSHNNYYISEQDVGLRMLAGFNYGLITVKHMTGLSMSVEEKIYIKEQEKTVSELAWSAGSFYCTFFFRNHCEAKFPSQ